jgi:nicotinamidase-related amidase
MNIATLVICGLMTDQSVLFNTVQAVNLGYHVLLVEDACTALTLETHAAFIRWYKTFVNVKPTKEIISTIEKETASKE